MGHAQEDQSTRIQASFCILLFWKYSRLYVTIICYANQLVWKLSCEYSNCIRWLILPIIDTTTNDFGWCLPIRIWICSLPVTTMEWLYSRSRGKDLHSLLPRKWSIMSRIDNWGSSIPPLGKSFYSWIILIEKEPINILSPFQKGFVDGKIACPCRLHASLLLPSVQSRRECFPSLGQKSQQGTMHLRYVQGEINIWKY